MAESALERELQKLKAMGVTITSKPALGHEADFKDRPFGMIQQAAERLGMTDDGPVYVVCDRLLDAEMNEHCEYDGRPPLDADGYWRCPGCGHRRRVTDEERKADV